jgi:hypothetical protein
MSFSDVSFGDSLIQFAAYGDVEKRITRWDTASECSGWSSRERMQNLAIQNNGLYQWCSGTAVVHLVDGRTVYTINRRTGSFMYMREERGSSGFVNVGGRVDGTCSTENRRF